MNLNIPKTLFLVLAVSFFVAGCGDKKNEMSKDEKQQLMMSEELTPSQVEAEKRYREANKKRICKEFASVNKDKC